MKLNFFIGYDSKEDIAYRVCKYSLLKRTNSDVNVMSLKLDELIAKNLYTRSIDPLASTQFTYSRFLVPKLTNYEGWAVFCDCDFIFLGDVSNLFKNLDENKAVYCVKHDYTPKEKHKMDGQKQTIYPRKNWSSFILYNCSHPSTKKLTVEKVNNETGAYLHQFKWCEDDEIGSLDERLQATIKINLTQFIILGEDHGFLNGRMLNLQRNGLQKEMNISPINLNHRF